MRFSFLYLWLVAALFGDMTAYADLITAPQQTAIRKIDPASFKSAPGADSDGGSVHPDMDTTLVLSGFIQKLVPNWHRWAIEGGVDAWKKALDTARKENPRQRDSYLTSTHAVRSMTRDLSGLYNRALEEVSKKGGDFSQQRKETEQEFFSRVSDRNNLQYRQCRQWIKAIMVHAGNTVAPESRVPGQAAVGGTMDLKTVQSRIETVFPTIVVQRDPGVEGGNAPISLSGKQKSASLDSAKGRQTGDSAKQDAGLHQKNTQLQKEKAILLRAMKTQKLEMDAQKLEMDALQQKNKQLTKANTDLAQHAQAEPEKTNAINLDQLIAEIKVLMSQDTQLQNQIMAAKNPADIEKALQTAKGKLATKIKELEDKITQADQANFKPDDALNKRITALTAQLKTAEEARDKRQSEANDKALKLAAKLQELTDQIVAKTAERERLENSAPTAANLTDEQKNQLSQLTEQAKNAQTALNNETAAVTQKQLENEQEQQELNEEVLQREKQQLATKIKERQDKITAKQTELKNLQDNPPTAANLTEEQQNQLSQLTEQANNAQTALDNETNAVTRKQKENAQRLDQLNKEKLQTARGKLNKEIQELKDQIEAQTNALDQLKNATIEANLTPEQQSAGLLTELNEIKRLEQEKLSAEEASTKQLEANAQILDQLNKEKLQTAKDTLDTRIKDLETQTAAQTEELQQLKNATIEANLTEEQQSAGLLTELNEIKRLEQEKLSAEEASTKQLEANAQILDQLNKEKLQTARGELNKEIQELKDQIEAQTNALDQLKNATIEANLTEEQQNQLSQLTEQANNAQTALDNETNAVTRKQKENAQRLDQLNKEKLQTARGKLNKEIQELKDQIEAQTNALDQLKNATIEANLTEEQQSAGLLTELNEIKRLKQEKLSAEEASTKQLEANAQRLDQLNKEKLQTARGELNKEIQELKDQIEAQTNALDQLKNATIEANLTPEQQSAGLLTELNEIKRLEQEKLSAEEASTKQLEANAQILDQLNKEKLQTARGELNKEIQELKDQIEAQTNALDQLKNATIEANLTDEQQNQLSQLNEQAKNAQTALDNETAAVTQKKLENEQEQTRLDNQAHQELQTAKDTLDTRILNLQAQIKEKQTELQNLQDNPPKKRELTEDEQEKLNQLNQELSAKQKALEQATNEVTQKKQTNAQKQTRLDNQAHQELQTAKQQLDTRILNLQAQIKEKQTELQNLQDNPPKKRELTEDEQENLNQLNQEAKNAQTALEQATNEVTQKQQTNAQALLLATKIQKLEKEKRKLKGRVEMLMGLRKKLREELKYAQGEKDRAQQEKNDAEKRNVALQNELDQVNGQLEAQYDELDELDELHELNEKLQCDLQEARGEKNDEKKRNVELQNELTKLEKEKGALEGRFEKLGGLQQNLQQNLREELKYAQGEKDRAQQEKNDAQERNVALQNKLDQVNGQLEAQYGELDELNGMVEMLSKERDDFRGQMDVLVQKNVSLRSELDKAKNVDDSTTVVETNNLDYLYQVLVGNESNDDEKFSEAHLEQMIRELKNIASLKEIESSHTSPNFADIIGDYMNLKTDCMNLLQNNEEFNKANKKLYNDNNEFDYRFSVLAQNAQNAKSEQDLKNLKQKILDMVQQEQS